MLCPCPVGYHPQDTNGKDREKEEEEEDGEEEENGEDDDDEEEEVGQPC